MIKGVPVQLFTLNKIMRICVLTGAMLFLTCASAVENTAAPPWPQDGSDLKPDAALKFGTLLNGMRYIIMHNNTPTDTVSLRFRFATGSMQENDAQQGV